MAWYDNLFSDPMAWASMLGTGMNVYTNYQNAQKQAQYNAMIQQIAANNMAQQQAYSQAMQGYLPAYMGMQNAYMGLMQPMLSGLMGAVNSPMNVGKYMQQLTDAQKMAILRPPMASLQARGVQPGGYWDSVVADTLAKSAQSDYATAVNAAAQEKNMMISGLASMLGGLGGLKPNLPMLPSPASGGYPPTPLMGQTGADPFSSYLATLAKQKAPQPTLPGATWDYSQYNQQLDNLINQWMSGTGTV